MNTNERFSQLRLRFTDPVQHDYEAIRPVILFAQPVSLPWVAADCRSFQAGIWCVSGINYWVSVKISILVLRFKNGI